MRRRECDAWDTARNSTTVFGDSRPTSESPPASRASCQRLEVQPHHAAPARLRHGGKMRNTSAPLRPPRGGARPRARPRCRSATRKAAPRGTRRPIFRPEEAAPEGRVSRQGFVPQRPTKRGQPRAEAQAAQGAGRRSKFVSAALF